MPFPKRTGAVGVVAPESLFFQEFKQRRDQRDVLPRPNLVHCVKQVRAGVVVQQRLVLGLVEEREERRSGGVGGELVYDEVDDEGTDCGVPDILLLAGCVRSLSVGWWEPGFGVGHGGRGEESLQIIQMG